MGPPGIGVGVVVNGFGDPNSPVVGQSISNNNLIGNRIDGSASSGVSLLSNRNATVRGNSITHNGFEPDGSLGTGPGNGIGVQNLRLTQADTRDLIEANVITGNSRNGIAIGDFETFPTDNTIRNNVSKNNAVLDAGAFDLNDANPACDHNVWFGNVWGSGGFNPPCTTNGGHGPAPAAAVPQKASPLSTPAAAPVHGRPCGRCEG